MEIQVDKDSVQLIVERMKDAYREDRDANDNKEPAFAKLKMLPELLNILQKRNVREYLAEGVLEGCRDWLSPLPDGSLPNMKIREGILRGLAKLDLQEDLLLSSGIGKSVMLLSKHSKETLPNRKICRTLISKWSRPIFAISSTYADLERIETEADEQKRQSGRKLKRKLSGRAAFDEAFETQATSQETNAPRYTIRPQKVRMDYVIRPKGPEVPEERKNKEEKSTKAQRIHEKILSLKSPRRAKTRALSIGINKLNK